MVEDLDYRSLYFFLTVVNNLHCGVLLRVTIDNVINQTLSSTPQLC